MKKILTFAIALVLCTIANAQSKKNKAVDHSPVQDEWNDVEIFEQHKLYPRANVIPYSNENDIEKNNYIESPYYVSLNGEWHIDVSSEFDDRITNMEQKDFSASGWPTVTIPDGKRTLPSRGISIATYSRSFDVPKAWKDYHAYLNIQAKSAYYIWINQQYVGYSEDSRDISEFDITKHLLIGKRNNIVIQVFSISDGSMLETNYSHVINGITSDAYIVLKPLANVMDYNIGTSFTSTTKNADFSLDIDIFNATKKGQYYVEMELWNPQGRQIDKTGRWTVFDKKNEIQLKFERNYSEIEPWSAETPNLYTLVIRLRDAKMNLLETVGCRFGFRTVKVENGLMTVNGQPVTLRGVNYTCYDNQKGVNLDRELVRKQLVMMKSHNINAVRTMMYSPALPFFYELCDELGLYVVCDANIHPYSTQSKAVATDKNYINMFISRVQNMYERLKNHPSIISWSLGDSQDNGICMENAYRILKKKDSSRPVIFPGAGYSENTDLIATSNNNYDDLKLFAAKNQPRAMMMSSFGSSKGNSYGNIEPLWQLVRSNNCLQGGFANYWNGASFFDVNSQNETKVSGMIGEKDEPLPYLSELRNIYRPFDIRFVNISPDAAEFNVSNLLSFLSLKDYILEYNIFSNLKSRIIEGEVSVALKPGESKNFKLKIPALTLYAGEELFIRFTIRQRKDNGAVPKGTELGVVEFPLPMKEIKKEMLATYDREELFVTNAGGTEGKDVIQVFNDNIEMWYDLKKADIISYKFHDRDLLLSTPQLNFWRAATDNDRVDKNALRQWQKLSPDNLHRTVIATNWRQVDNNTVCIDAMLRYYDNEENALFDVKQSMAILYTGDVLIDNEIVATEQIRTLPKIGMQMCVPKYMDSIRWFGLDKETYTDRRSSGVAGTYKRDVRSLFYLYNKPQESGNRAGVRWVSLEDNGIGLFFDLLDTNFNFSIYPYTDVQLYEAVDKKSLQEQDFWTLNIDYRQAAIGSALSGSEVPAKDLVSEKYYHFRMHLRAYDITEYNPYDFCRVEYPEVASSVLPMPIIKKDRERFDKPMTITLTSETPKAVIRYTLDGSTPDENSPLYKKPFVIANSTYVKAKAFKEGSTPSFTAITRFNFDYITRCQYADKPNTPYNYNQESLLFDGEKADIRELSRGWLGFSGNDLNVIFELSKAIDLQQVVTNFAHVPDAWAFAPVAVQVFVSEDGENYSAAIPAKIKYAPEEESMNKPEKVTVTVDVNRDKIKFVKLVAKNMGRIPAWHKARGLKPWIMVDEVQLIEVIKDSGNKK